ncbi:hypothetical protein K2173_006551 [Erythroxylum novogranatense]|uniref:Xyloglucan endotransglucosylase/hydrolase n=1 Tax=Erythroxylum novogranatense TaxID=1862640 RepID=A0AAV8T6M5_9ROSI|nr:hypothetical protein K2173_006551 [Erythroxylum novogranatense]
MKMAKEVSIILLSTLFIGSFLAVSAGSFYKDVDITWGDGRAKILQGGKELSLTMDKFSGAGFQSHDEFLFGRFDVEMKLVPGNSAGTVTTFYLSSSGPKHNEVDLEFCGNLTGDPYTLHTNVYVHGKGHREQEFHLWFDPTEDFHKYTVIWNPKSIIIFVDNVPIRVFKNKESYGAVFPNEQKMRIYASLWNGEQWATRGGLIKTDWSAAPFTAYYRNFNAITTDTRHADKSWMNYTLSPKEKKLLLWVQKNHRIFNYCADPKRNGGPRECRDIKFLKRTTREAALKAMQKKL